MEQLNKYYTVWQECNNVYEEWAKAHGLSMNSLLIFFSIQEDKQNCTQKAISQKWLIPKQTVNMILKDFEKRGLIEGTIERIGNMPDRTIYSLTDKGGDELKETIRESIIQFSFDTNIFTIAAFVMDILETEEKEKLLEKRLNILQSYLTGISKQDNEVWKQEAPDFHVANLERMIDIVQAEISGTKRLLSVIGEGKNNEE